MDEMNLLLILWGISLISYCIACIGVYLIFRRCKTMSDQIDRVKDKKFTAVMTGLGIVTLLAASICIEIIL